MVNVCEVFDIPEFDVSDVPGCIGCIKVPDFSDVLDVPDVPEVYPEMLCYIFNYQLTKLYMLYMLCWCHVKNVLMYSCIVF